MALSSLDLLLAATRSARDELMTEAKSISPAIDSRLHARDVLGFESACNKIARVVGPHWTQTDHLYRGFDEIARSIACLHNIPVYIRRFPYRDTSIARSDHLQYHMENWFNELYILHERFECLCVRIERAFKRDSAAAEIAAAAARANSLVTMGLDEARQIRGAHVHEWRVVGPGIGMLRELELLAADASGDLMLAVENEYRGVRSELAKHIVELNGLVDVVIESACTLLAVAVLTPEGALRQLPAV